MSVALFRRFPLQRPDENHARFYAAFWSTHVIVHAVAREVRYDEHASPLSVKCVFGGREMYQVDRRTVAVEDDAYFVVNHGRTYASWIEERAPVESLAVFFQRGFVGDVYRVLVTRRAEQLLDEPESSRDIAFFEQLHRHDVHVSPVLRRLRSAAGRSPGWLEEQVHALAEGLVRAHGCAHADAQRLPALRASTRLELYRRVHRGRDFLDSNVAHPVTLADAARAAALAPHHFLRTFRAAFGVTPLRYLAARRLERARTLLETTTLPIAEIAHAVGMSDASSLTRAFRRHFGCAPSRLREKQSRPSAPRARPLASAACTAVARSR